MEELALLRRQLQVGMLTQEQMRSLRLKIGDLVDQGNRVLDLDLIPREESGHVPRTERVGPVHLCDLVR